MLAEGFDLTQGSVVPFLSEPPRPKIIDRVSEGLAIFDDGETIPVREIYNPDGINLEGATYSFGQAYPSTQRLENARKMLEKMLEKDSMLEKDA
jgi:hypothetical protein